ncbi:glycosyltransferase family 2 protein [uncultured Chryseobacterium sp.]|uniref:glycosyltransferase family 2 protein n=1 Tax=uncultured Chryseobacterium sp. TaxID=259322 RepID=UPI002617C414|nr:glycosyltransferase family 2 protein [uncultured Chryseobacterium sp.]
MTDVFIKSFNRPFYLDRCLQSVEKFVRGNFKVTVLDDGTPEKYLDKIREKFPEAEIITSKNYSKKIAAIEENLKSGKEINGFEIPTDLWIDAAKNGSDYFIMTEDDVWFTQKINIIHLVTEMKKLDVSLLKLGWLGNLKDDENLEIESVSEQINSMFPKSLFLGNEGVMTAFFNNRYKFFTILFKLGLVDNYTQQKYWSLVSILMGLYKKEYWLQTWQKMDGKVDEKRQLINASSYYRNFRHNRNFLGRTKTEVMKTTFQSSSTNSYHKYGDAFDVNIFNHQINEAWFKGDFNAMQNFPKDFTLEYFEQFLDEKIDKKEFRNWVANFRKHYREIGCNVQ